MNDELKQFILQLSAQAGEYLRNHFYSFKNVFQKDIGALVTNVDLELEEILSQRIRREFPNHGIMLVGHDKQLPKSDYLWVIDALDGSSHFARGIPMYTSNIALLHKGETLFGAVNQAQTNQLYFAQKDDGAYLNGIDINVSDQTDLDKAFVYVELPEHKFSSQSQVGPMLEKNLKSLDALIKNAAQVETFRIGAFGQCLVAGGSFDAYVDLSGSSRALSQAASTLIVKEAGGEIVDLEKLENGFVQVMATNGKLTESIRENMR